jgi:hypothetical protein
VPFPPQGVRGAGHGRKAAQRGVGGGSRGIGPA